MKYKYSIHQAPRWFRWFGRAGLCLGKHIWVLWDLPMNKGTQILEHELQHSRDWQDLGTLRFLWRYVTIQGRLHLEARGYARSVLMGRSLERCAQSLAGRMYMLWGVGFDDIMGTIDSYRKGFENE